jgi:hypothetical protein
MVRRKQFSQGVAVNSVQRMEVVVEAKAVAIFLSGALIEIDRLVVFQQFESPWPFGENERYFGFRSVGALSERQQTSQKDDGYPECHHER